jgi:hypothetical protein
MGRSNRRQRLVNLRPPTLEARGRKGEPPVASQPLSNPQFRNALLISSVRLAVRVLLCTPAPPIARA